MPAIARNGHIYGASPNIPVNADDVTYDNSTSELESTTAQDAIDELKDIVDNIIDDNTTYTIGTSENTVTLTPSEGEVQSITVPYATNAGSASNASSVSGHTVATDVPADAVFTDTTYENATTAVDGLMSASDKSKLDNVASGAEVNQNAFSNFVANGTTVVADTKTDTLTLEAGSNVSITGDSTNDIITISATDTTYENATTSTAGLMSTSDKAKVDALGTAATKNFTTSVTSGSSDLVTSGAVYTAIDNLPEPMVFKGSLGTGGTITTLPVNGSASIGDTYKVITAGTYASKSAKVGDTFICLTKTSSANTWELIPSGDEPSGTVTSITLKATSPIAIDSSSAITTSGTRTLSHANSGATAGSYGDSSDQTPAYNATFKVPYITVNATGHVTAISEHTVKIPASDNTDSKVTSAANHYTPSAATASELTASASGGSAAWSLDVVTGVQIQRDSKGHAVGLTVSSGKLPANPGDTKVRQSLSTANSNLPLLLSYANNSSTTANVDNVSYRSNNVYVNPSTGILTLYREGTTDNNYPTRLTFSNKNTTTGNTSSGYVAVYNGGANGSNMVIQSAGNTFIGSGESAQNHYNTGFAQSTGEVLYVDSDNAMHLQANAGTIANRVGVQIDTSGNLVPEKADVATDNIGGIGTSTYKWANGYFTNINGVAVGTPKFTDAAVYQSSTTTANWRKILLGGQNDSSSGTAVTNQTTQSYVSPSLEFQPSTGTLKATKFSGDISGGTGLTKSQVTTALGYTPPTSSVVSTSANGLAPKVTDTAKYLKGDGTWATPADTKVTSAANHYTPSAATASEISKTASGGTAAWDFDVVTGVKIKRDSKGHVTDMELVSGKVPANPNTDANVKVTNKNPESGTWYYPTWYTATSGTGGVNANNGLRYYALEGTTAAAGSAGIQLGNATASGTAGNKYGFLRIYGYTANYGQFAFASGKPTGNRTYTLPDKTGTVAMTSDVTDMQTTLQTNFQAGVDSVYDAIVARGTTPASKSLSDVVTGIGNIQTIHSTTYTPTSRASNCNMGSIHTYRYVDTRSVPNSNSGTYTPAGNSIYDMGATNTNRYCDGRTAYTAGYNAKKAELVDTYAPTSRSSNLNMGANHTYRYVDTTGVPNTNSGTYTPAGNAIYDMGATNTNRYCDGRTAYTAGYNKKRDELKTTYAPTSRSTSLDMGSNHSYRYVDTSSVPNTNSATYDVTSNGVKNMGATNTYRYLNVNVPHPEHTTTYKPTTRASNCDMGSVHSYRYVNTTSVPNSNSGTYDVTSNGVKDMTATNSYRYVNVNVPNSNSGTSSTTYTTNGTKDLGASHTFRYVTINVSNSNSGTYTSPSMTKVKDMGATNSYRYVKPGFTISSLTYTGGSANEQKSITLADDAFYAVTMSTNYTASTSTFDLSLSNSFGTKVFTETIFPTHKSWGIKVSGGSCICYVSCNHDYSVSIAKIG